MKPTPDQLTDLLVNRVKRNVASSDMLADKDTLRILKTLHSVPRKEVPLANYERVRNQILDRIAIPKEETVMVNGWFGLFMQTLPRVARIAGGVVGSFLILTSVGMATAVAALDSVPGQAIYPFKTVVENIQLKLASTETEKVNLEIKFANNRLEELEKILEKSKQGKVSGAEVTKIVEDTVRKVEETTAKIASKTADSNSPTPTVTVLNKAVDLSTKQTALLEAATIQTEGDVKLEMEKALEASKISREKAIENIEKAGLKVEEKPIVLEDDNEPETETIEAHGKITAVTSTSISLGSAKFLLTKTTKFANIKQDQLEADQTINVKGEIVDSKIYAIEIELTSNEKTTENEEEQEPEVQE
jgi:hypothetical protein